MYRRLAEWLGRQLEGLEPLREEAEDWLLAEAKTHPIIRKLATAPGMGPIRTAQVVAIVGDPHRFRTRRQFWSYCGLGIVTRSSSDWVREKTGRWVRAEIQQTRGLSRKRHPLLKSVFKGAATTVIGQLPGHPLHEDYQRTLQAGIKPNLAKLTLARRIAAMVLSMWKHQEVYDPERQRKLTEKAIGAPGGEATAERNGFGVDARERFEGEHPLVSWSSGRDGEIPVAGYAPSEYRLKPWPHEALSGAWCPRFLGGNAGFEVERIAGRSSAGQVAGLTPADPIAQIGASHGERPRVVEQSPVAGGPRAAAVEYSLDNSFLRS